jgi:hypothetical protein
VGSYTVAFEIILVAVFTFLSAWMFDIIATYRDKRENEAKD